MSRSDNDRLGDIIRSGRRLGEVVAHGRDVYVGDWSLQDVAARNIETIAEAYSHLSPDARQLFGDLPEREMAGMRVILARIYWRADNELVWTVLTDDIPDILNSAVSNYQPPPSGPSPLDEDVTLPPREARPPA